MIGSPMKSFRPGAWLRAQHASSTCQSDQVREIAQGYVNDHLMDSQQSPMAHLEK